MKHTALPAAVLYWLQKQYGKEHPEEKILPLAVERNDGMPAPCGSRLGDHGPWYHGFCLKCGMVLASQARDWKVRKAGRHLV